jgi:hypothetical protein
MDLGLPDGEGVYDVFARDPQESITQDQVVKRTVRPHLQRFQLAMISGWREAAQRQLGEAVGLSQGLRPRLADAGGGDVEGTHALLLSLLLHRVQVDTVASPPRRWVGPT